MNTKNRNSKRNRREDFPLVAWYSFELSLIDRQKVRVTYDGVTYNQGHPNAVHFRLYGKAISETGFRSHFTYLPAVEEYVTPYDYAKELSEHLWQEQKEKMTATEKAELQYGKQQRLF